MKDRVAIIGTGVVNNPGRQYLDKSFKQLLVESSYKAIKDAGIRPEEIEGASFSYAGESEVGHGGIAPTLIDALGLAPIPAFVNSANCASGHTAFLQGCDMIKSGKYKYVLVSGFDKFTDVLPFEDYMLISSDSMYDFNLGFSHVDQFLLETEYFRKNNIPPDIQKKALLKYAKLAYSYGQKNPVACRYNMPIPPDQMLSQLPFYGCVLTSGEGSAAMILTSEQNVSELNVKPIFVEATSYVTTSHYVGHRYEANLVKGLDSTTEHIFGDALPLEIACKNVYKEAALTPKDIGTIGVYDMLVNQFMSLEASGICKKGEAVDFILAGKGEIDSDCPINTDGGNIGRGFAGGCGGIYPLIEISKQLQGTARGLQIQKPIRYGLSTFLGGAYAHAVAVIMSNQ